MIRFNFFNQEKNAEDLKPHQVEEKIQEKKKKINTMKDELSHLEVVENRVRQEHDLIVESTKNDVAEKKAILEQDEAKIKHSIEKIKDKRKKLESDNQKEVKKKEKELEALEKEQNNKKEKKQKEYDKKIKEAEKSIKEKRENAVVASQKKKKKLQ